MLSVVADFDGTLVEKDLPELALERFGKRGWKRYDQLLATGKISVEQCVAKQYAMIDVRTHQQILGYIDGFCQFREGCDKLLSECRRLGVGFTIVSAGLDFCIRHAFRVSGLETPRLVCPKSSLVAGKGFRLSFPPLRNSASRDFKEDVVMCYREKGDRVVFIGDGAGDLNAAVQADFLFTIRGSRLDTICTQRRIHHLSIGTMVPVVRFIRAKLAQSNRPRTV
ncbi:MAG TPA: HAD-IB family phosphatase [Nitrososphaerales archaeon]|nr:HAD-IB family phosphatase [Nitrososphaerales archaeon]